MVATAEQERPFEGRDFSHVRGLQRVKRAPEIAAAGEHNVLLSGAPGSGKALLARAVPSRLPPMQIDEALEVTKSYSVAGRLAPDVPVVARRPFRAPHHSISHAGLVGEGRWPSPGEISLAHRGVLFLDELPQSGQADLEKPPGAVFISGNVAESICLPLVGGKLGAESVPPSDRRW